MNILVTERVGFIGTAVVGRLAVEGHRGIARTVSSMRPHVDPKTASLSGSLGYRWTDG